MSWLVITTFTDLLIYLRENYRVFLFFDYGTQRYFFIVFVNALMN